MHNYKNNLFYQEYEKNKEFFDFKYGEDYLDCISHDRYLVLIPFNLKVMQSLQPYMVQTHNCLITSQDSICPKNYFILPYVNNTDAIKIFVFDLEKFKIDEKNASRKIKQEIFENNQEAFFTFWLDRTTTEPLKEGYCYGGQYFNIIERHKECNYKTRKKGIVEHKEFFYNIKENLIDIVKNDALTLTKGYTRKTILSKLKAQYKYYYVWDRECSEYFVINSFQYKQLIDKVIIEFNTWD